MSHRWRIIWITGFVVLLSLFAIRTADASLGPADEHGRVLVPALQPLGQAITLNDTPVYCAPTSEDDYGWISDRDDPDSLTGYGDDGHIDWSNVAINISGDICSQLERLTRWPQNSSYFRDRLPRPIKKGQNGKVRWDIEPNWNLYDASIGVLTLVHEAMHVRLQSTDEGLVECTAVHNLWPTVSALHVPGKTGKAILADALDNHLQAPDEYLAVC